MKCQDLETLFWTVSNDIIFEIVSPENSGSVLSLTGTDTTPNIVSHSTNDADFNPSTFSFDFTAFKNLVQDSKGCEISFYVSSNDQTIVTPTDDQGAVLFDGDLSTGIATLADSY